MRAHAVPNKNQRRCSFLKRRAPSKETTGAPINFDRESYKKRHFAENVIGKGKEFRRVAFRFDRHTESYAAMIYATLIKKILALWFSDGT